MAKINTLPLIILILTCQVYADKSLADKELKRAYRRLLAQHHPDKLVAKGLPEEMIKLANEKTQKIISAYEIIKKHRDMR